VKVTKPKTQQKGKNVTHEEFIINLFCRVDDQMKSQKQHPKAKLSKSELVTIGLLFALKGTSQHSFYRWLRRNFSYLFPALPERTRLFRRLKTHHRLTDCFLAKATVLGVADSFGIELCHPIRERRQPQRKRFAKKGLSNWRWIVGGKLCIVANKLGLITAYKAATANVSDVQFHPLIEQFDGQMIVYVDKGFRAQKRNPENMKVCQRGTCNERMLIETVFSLLTQVCNLKRLRQRVFEYFEMRLAFTVALFNILQQWNGLEFDEQGVFHLSMAKFSL
jgi:hypothetical protein